MADSYEKSSAEITDAFSSLGPARAQEITALVTGPDGNAVVQQSTTIDAATLAQAQTDKSAVLNVTGGGTFDLGTLPSTLKVLVFTVPVVINGQTFFGTVLLGPGDDSVNFSLTQAASGSTTGTTIDAGAGSNTVVASSGADIVYVGSGAKDTIEGGAGVDTIIITGKMAAFALKVVGSKVVGDNVTLGTHLEATNSEIMQFDDGVVVNAANANEAAMARFYEVVLNRTPDAAGVLSWMDGMRAGKTMLIDAANGFLHSAEASAKGIDTLPNSAFLDTLYEQAFGRAADAAGKADWLRGFDQGMTRAEVVVGFAVSPEAEIVITGVHTITGLI